MKKNTGICQLLLPAAACKNIQIYKVFNIVAIAVVIVFSGCTKAPVADFSTNHTTVYAYEKVSFYDCSIGDPNSWTWTFTNAVPSSSADQNPTVYWVTGGTDVKCNVSLFCSNSKGSNTKTKNSYITVKPNLTVWANFQVPPEIEVYLSNTQADVYSASNYKGNITNYYVSNPGCGSAGCVSASFNGTVYYYAVKTDSTHSWEGSIDIDTRGCNTINLQLTDSTAKTSSIVEHNCDETILLPAGSKK